MSESAPRPTSVWHRFWSPGSLLERIPSAASSSEADAIEARNELWLKTYMDMYILRWGGLWAALLAVTVLLVDAPGMLFALALAGNLAALAGLVTMILRYRRASVAVRERIRRNAGP